MSMRDGLDARLAERIVGTAMCLLRPTPGNKILCTKAALREAILAAVDEAHEIGFLAGQKEQCAEITCPGSPDRPAWMDIRLDDPDDLARNHIRFQPVVLRSLLGAGYRCLGDLRWVPGRDLMNLHYVGFKWAGEIRAVVRRFETGAGGSLILKGISIPAVAGEITRHHRNGAGGWKSGRRRSNGAMPDCETAL